MARIYKRGRTYYSDIFFPQHPKADKRGHLRTPLSRDKDHARLKLGDLIRQCDAAKDGRRPPAGSSWESFLTRFRKFLERLSRITRMAYQRAIRLLEHAHPIKDISEVTPALLDDLYGHWKGKRGLYVRNRDMKCLKAMMGKAEAWGLVAAQDWETIKIDEEPRGRLLYYEIEDFRRLLKKCNGIWKTIAMLGARAGLRRGEIRWLHRDDVDFKRNLLHIDSKAAQGWTVKNYERRSVPMAKDLREHLEKTLSDGREWIIEHDGERPTINSMTVYFTRIVRRAGLRGSLHTLRHTFGAWLAIAGRRLEEIRDLMGHRTTITTEIYAHLRPDAGKNAIESLPAL